MKHAVEDGVLQTNLLQAFQKNKIIQGKLNERQRSYYVELIKDMQDYKLKEKLNKELLYTWKKESYVRQLKKNLQDYERKRFGVRDAYYEYQARNLDSIISGQQGLVIPPREEERRLNVNTKFRQFLDEHPLKTSASMRVVQSANLVKNIKGKPEKKEEEDVLAVEETWKQIHAQSAIGLRRKRPKFLPTLQRSSTMDEIRRNKTFNKSLIPPTVAVVASVIVTTTPELVNVTLEDKDQAALLPLKASPVHATMIEGVEPVLITSQTLEKQTRADLVTMRSVRRPQKNPIDLNMTFESRKRIYQINKRVYNYQLCHRKCALQYNARFDRQEPTNPADDEENLLIEMSETNRRRYEDRHQSDKVFI
ncbi:unnamed protein product [Rotaria socialis]|uniref:Uncharacterized protein n=2 Tax=Rotaria socialis TaxID=392032 RepID=A0A820DQ34_9BILA|nr:unnamed protein product [Rotaria socialis]CAF3350177.1 unnamed protein product [Rotaria socialis]CAF3489022.1 unnamed protein product [Rotaria socialis]CAF3505087.1 unnamed protein product [Rotaria socialis]CAF3581393.1 unnamed protein product [Rotaria socialis]